MHIYRLLGALMIASGGILCARWLNFAVRSSLSQVEGFILLVRFIRTQIDCYRMPLPRILQRCSNEIYSACGYSKKTPPSVLSELLSACSISDPQAKKYVCEFVEIIGSGYVEEQLDHCDRCLGLLESRRAELAAYVASRQKVNASICICASLAVVILLF